MPQLHFEVVADEGPVGAGMMLGGDGGPAFDGYALAARTLGDVARDIGRLVPFAVENGAARFEAGETHALEEDACGVARVLRTGESALPASISIDHADAARDYQAGRQSARRLNGGLSDETIALPAVLGAAGAKALAEIVLARAWRERTRCEVSVDWRALAIIPGDLVTLPGDATVWRVMESIVEGGAVRLSLVVHGATNALPGSADGGRATGETDLPAGETRLAVLDLPPLGAPSDEARVAFLANGASGGWRRAALSVSRDGGVSWAPLGASALPATIGVAAGVLAAGPAAVIDRVNHIDVTLAHAALTLSDADHDALTNGANLAMLGDEAIQFARALPMGGAAWRLGDLWRGRRGTEAAIGDHGAGESFALLDPAAMRFLAAEEAIAGAVVAAQGVGDAYAVEAVVSTVGRAARPLSPAALRGDAVTGGVLIGWTRRSRDGFSWREGVDAPLAEEREAYLATAVGGGAMTNVEIAAPEWLLPSGFAAAGTTVTVTVRQIGRAGLSDAATIEVIL